MIHRFVSIVRSALFTTLPLFAACSGGGGGSDSGVPARVPDGTGKVAIQMIGTWEIRSATVIDTNDPAAQPPLNGTRIVIGPQGVASIAGLSVVRTELEAVLGFPLDVYVNQVDGKTILYGLGYDRRAQGGLRQQVGLAAGSVDDNSIAVEQFTSTQTPSQANEVFVRSRYTLARLSAAIVLPIDDAAQQHPGTADLAEILKPLFGR